MKLSKGSRFDIIENKGLFYIKPSETGAFILGEKNGTKGRLYTTDKGVSNLIKESYNVKSGSFMLHIGVNPVVVHSETNCFILNK